MSPTRPLTTPASAATAACCAPLAAHLPAYRQYLLDRGNVDSYVRGCEAAIAHFSLWMAQSKRPFADINEELVAEFTEEHLPRCQCATSARRREDVRAALVHLLVVLRSVGAIAPEAQDTTPVGDELRRFDQHMVDVQGLAARTRENALLLVGRLLRSRFTDGAFEFGAITPDHIRAFFAEQAKLYKTPKSIRSVVSALRLYLRWRSMLGDRIHALAGAISSPACWQQSSLPKALAPVDVQQLVASLGQPGPSMRRADAMVRCALDLGLRIGEVARLGLDDIDWRAGTVTLRRTKGRREDVMPLPEPTGRAIAAYLFEERPQTQHRMVFASHKTPRERCISAALVGKTIREAYARAGLRHTSAHLLRHTMASRLLAGGSTLKEVADILRHRSLNTTLIYAKLDSRRLLEVALPWPGSPASSADGSPV